MRGVQDFSDSQRVEHSERSEKPSTNYLAKRIRAHDGCLGIGRRRRTRKTATSCGEPSTGIDPQISEWGNPPLAMGRYRKVEYIDLRGHTRGSETSQYPQEEKSNEIA